MLSERITVLYEVLQCGSSEIARFAGCSSGNISRLKSGNRVPGKKSRTIDLLTEGIYSYADYEALLPELKDLTGAENTSREILIPAIKNWLYSPGEVTHVPHTRIRRSKRKKTMLRQSFGERLKLAMTALELSNNQLAALLNVDTSLISRWRKGLYSPHGNEVLSHNLAAVLVTRAEKLELQDKLEALCGTTPDVLTVSQWLYEVVIADSTALAHLLLHSIDDYTPNTGDCPRETRPSSFEMRERYWGTEGLRNAVLRFLSETEEEGGELWLHSDETIDWITGDSDFLSCWISMMMKCVKRGVRIRIIHHMGRTVQETVSALKAWYPLYMSGLIEPYFFNRDIQSRFCHTCFLRVGSAAIQGVYPQGSGEHRYYEYITDAERLTALREEYRILFASARPFLKTYTEDMGEDFRRLMHTKPGPRNYLVSSLPIFTMPPELITRIIGRLELPENKKVKLRKYYHEMNHRFTKLLEKEPVNLVLCVSQEKGARPVNFSLDMLGLSLRYEREEYEEHLEAIKALVNNERNFHLTLLPSSPFKGLQLVTIGDTLAALHCRGTLAAFVYVNSSLTQSVCTYFDTLMSQYPKDRADTAECLKFPD